MRDLRLYIGHRGVRLFRDGDRLFWAGGGGAFGGFDDLWREFGNGHVGVAVFVTEVKDVRGSHVAQRVPLAQVRVDLHVHGVAQLLLTASAAASSSSRVCQICIISASPGPTFWPGVNVAGRCW